MVESPHRNSWPAVTTLDTGCHCNWLYTLAVLGCHWYPADLTFEWTHRDTKPPTIMGPGWSLIQRQSADSKSANKAYEGPFICQVSGKTQILLWPYHIVLYVWLLWSGRTMNNPFMVLWESPEDCEGFQTAGQVEDWLCSFHAMDSVKRLWNRLPKYSLNLPWNTMK